jgi:hypothetical protein
MSNDKTAEQALSSQSLFLNPHDCQYCNKPVLDKYEDPISRIVNPDHSPHSCTGRYPHGWPDEWKPKKAPSPKPGKGETPKERPQ